MMTAVSFNALRSRVSSSPTLTFALAAAICLAASFLNFLNHNRYPVAMAETALCIAALCLVAVPVGIVCARLRARKRTLFSALFLAIVVQMNLDGGVLVVAATALAAIMLANRAMTFAGIASFVVLLFQSVQAFLPSTVTAAQVEAAAPADGKPLPLIVHVLLDGAIGIEGMPADIPVARQAASWGRDWLIDRGFAVYGRAYSEHKYTVNSVPHILGFGSEDQVEVEKVLYGYDLRSNRYMAGMKERGYTITVYQNHATQYCGNPDVDACWMARGYRALAQSGLSTFEKTGVLMRSFASLSAVIGFSAQVYDYAVASVPHLAAILPPFYWSDGHVPTALGAMQTLEELTDRVAHAGPGEFHFAHVLLPHAPYAFDENCTIKPQHDWTGPFSRFRSRRELYTAYAGQWRCAVRRIGELSAVLQAAQPEGGFVLLVHGDHGSRIPPSGPAPGNTATRSPQSLRDTYSTLAAIHMPDVPSGYFRDVVSVRHLLEALVAGRFEGRPTVGEAEPPTIIVQRPGRPKPEGRRAVPRLFEID